MCTWGPALVINDIFLKVCFPGIFSTVGIWEEFKIFIDVFDLTGWYILFVFNILKI